MTKASDNVFPKVTFVEGAAPASPAATDFSLYFDSADHLLKWKNSAGTVTTIATGAAGMSNPMTTDWDLIRGGAAGVPTVLPKGVAGAVLALGNGALIYNAGTSFPASKATNDRYWRTDLGMEFYWDGTRWVSSQLFAFSGGITPVAGTADTNVGIPMAGDSIDLWMVDFRVAYQVAAPHSGTQFWTITLHKYDNSTDTVIATVVTDKATTTYNNPAAVAIGALLGTGIKLFYMDAAKTSTAGALQYTAEIRYRIVRT